ncbi:MAG TPA: hypothetical protein VGM27_24830 [Acidobacteriaceae bacterium]
MGASTARPKSLLDTPPSQPQVSCIGNQLTIKADNATVSSVLTAVGGCIGTKIEVPEGAAGERLYMQFGPGPIEETLVSLLYSIEYDFVIGTSPSNPQKIETVLLMRRTEENVAPATADSAGGPARRAWSENRRNTEAAMRAAREEAGEVEPEPVESATSVGTPAAPAAVDSPQVPASPTDAPATGTASASNANLPAAATAGTPALSTPGKSTQDLISDMQQLFEQRRQMTQGQKTTP